MGKSKNDIQKNGGIIRVLHNSDHGKKIASVKIINKETARPFTYRQIDETLSRRKNSCAASLPKILKYQDMIQDKVQKIPDAEFTMSRTRDTKEEADKAVELEVMPNIDELTVILFQPYLVDQSATGSISLSDFYHFQKNSIFKGCPDSTQVGCRCAMNQTLLPVLGKFTLKKIESTDWMDLEKKVQRKLRSDKAGKSKTDYTSQALKKLSVSIEQFNKKAAVNLSLMSESVRPNEKNTDIRQAFVPNHLDEAQRKMFFQKVKQHESGEYLLFLVACIYMGLSLPLLTCHTFGEIERIDTVSGERIFSLLITKAPGKNGKTVNVEMEEFPLKYFRTIVFSQWAADILVQRVEQLRRDGYPSVGNLTLSTICQGEPDAPQAEEALCRILRGIKGLPIKIPRENRMGGIRMETVNAALKLLYDDAYYVLSELCKANSIMVHASVGKARNTVDEKHYLDIFSPYYTVHRYHVQCRFNPFRATSNSLSELDGTTSVHYADSNKQVHIRVDPSATTQRISVSGKFAFCAAWEGRK